MKKWLNLGGEPPPQPAAVAQVPDQPTPADASLPHRRGMQVEKGDKVEKAERLALRGLPTPPARIAGDADNAADAAQPAQ